MRCPECGFQVQAKARFCAGCGLLLDASCSQCQKPLIANAKYCHNCGAPCPIQKNKQDAALSPDKAANPERRHLTVMFCDLVGSTAFSEQLDPEDLRELIKNYQEACTGVIATFSGYVSRYMGDGILVFFGYPHAHENDAERAVHAGLGIISAISNLDNQFLTTGQNQLAVRIGISTGQVVAGDLIGEGASEEKVVFGETPIIAARLQSLATAGALLISESTRKLVQNLFEFDSLGPTDLKGISQPINVYHVLAESDTQRRLETETQRGLNPLIGREAEIGLLKKCWEQAKAEENRIILLSAEAGIGKSRLVQGFKELIGKDDLSQILYFCSTFYSNSNLYPVIEQLQRAMGWYKSDSSEHKLKKMEAMLSNLGMSLSDTVPYIASLMSLPTNDRYPELNVTPIELKRKTLNLLVSIVEVMASQQPVLMVVEDAHWIDPSTIELIDLIVEGMDGRRFMLVITYRPEFEPPWISLSKALMLRLNRMSRQESIAVILRQTGGKTLPDNVMERILSKTDGVPLFIEEFTKTLLESPQIEDLGDHYALTGQLSPLAVPASLQDSLVARLDRLTSAKELANLAATIGRGASYELLSKVSDFNENDLQTALTELLQAEVLYRRGMEPDVYYEFKHALLQDAAYQSLLKTVRQHHHKKIANVLVDYFPKVVEIQPELIAHHFTESGDPEQAINYWLRAGQRAIAHSANFEAIAHFNRGLRMIEKLPEDNKRKRQELEFYLALGPALMSTRGFAVSEVEQTYVRGRELCSEVGTPEQLFTASWGLWLYRQQRGQMDKAWKIADELLEQSSQQDDGSIQLQAHHAAWTTSYRLAKFSSCCQHSEQGIGLYNRELHQSLAHAFGGHDAGICAFQHAALSRWIMGYPEQAAAHKKRMLVLTKRLNNPFSTALNLNFASFLCQLLGEGKSTHKLAAKVAKVCSEYGVAPQYLNSSKVLMGWAAVSAGQVEQGLQQMRTGLDDHRKAPARAHEAYLLSLLVEVCIHQGLIDEAEQVLNEAFNLVERTGERTWLAELHRLNGEIQQSDIYNKPDLAEQAFDQAIFIARQEQAKSFELRAATSLARLWKDLDQKLKARDLLVPIYDSFTEGYKTADLKQSAALIEQLN